MNDDKAINEKTTTAATTTIELEIKETKYETKCENYVCELK